MNGLASVFTVHIREVLSGAQSWGWSLFAPIFSFWIASAPVSLAGAVY